MDTASSGGRVRRGHSCEVGRLKGSHGGVTAQLTHVASSSIHPTAQRRFIERMDWFLDHETLACVEKKGGLLRRALNHMDSEPIPTFAQPIFPSTPPPCPLVSARARGQVLSRGRHNWPND